MGYPFNKKTSSENQAITRSGKIHTLAVNENKGDHDGTEVEGNKLIKLKSNAGEPNTFSKAQMDVDFEEEGNGNVPKPKIVEVPSKDLKEALSENADPEEESGTNTHQLEKAEQPNNIIAVRKSHSEKLKPSDSIKPKSENEDEGQHQD